MNRKIDLGDGGVKHVSLVETSCTYEGVILHLQLSKTDKTLGFIIGCDIDCGN